MLGAEENKAKHRSCPLGIMFCDVQLYIIAAKRYLQEERVTS